MIDPARPGYRLIPYEEGEASLNMATDDAILRLFDVPTLRFYGWNPPAISLGHFQPGHENLWPLAESGLKLVRRMTGGGAIVHWYELTYSIFLKESHPLIVGRGARASYGVLHAPIVHALGKLGVNVQSGTLPVAQGAAPLLCFHRATELDLVAEGRKILGSAQRRTASRVLQHGSLILRANALQPGTAALDELLPSPISALELAIPIEAAFAEVLGPKVTSGLSEEERSLAHKLAPSYIFE